MSLKATPTKPLYGVARQATRSAMGVPVVMLTLSLLFFASITTGYTNGRPSGVISRKSKIWMNFLFFRIFVTKFAE